MQGFYTHVGWDAHAFPMTESCLHCGFQTPEQHAHRPRIWMQPVSSSLQQANSSGPTCDALHDFTLQTPFSQQSTGPEGRGTPLHGGTTWVSATVLNYATSIPIRVAIATIVLNSLVVFILYLSSNLFGSKRKVLRIWWVRPPS